MTPREAEECIKAERQRIRPILDAHPWIKAVFFNPYIEESPPSCDDDPPEDSPDYPAMRDDWKGGADHA